jgi:hypothetical protein
MNTRWYVHASNHIKRFTHSLATRCVGAHMHQTKSKHFAHSLTTRNVFFLQGLAALADGTFGRDTFALVASSFTNPGTWGSWHLFRTDVGVGDSAMGCSKCAPNGCDHACSLGANVTRAGTCAHPGSTDPALCCDCSDHPDPLPCAKCAASAGGCVALCVKAGHAGGGMCRYGDGSPNNLCCECFPE